MKIFTLMLLTLILLMGCSFKQSPIQAQARANNNSNDNSQNNTTNNYFNWNPEELRTELKKRDEQANELRDSLISSRKAVEVLSSRLVQVETRLFQPRSLSDEQQEKLTILLSAIEKREPLSLVTPGGDDEAKDFALMLAKPFADVKWPLDSAWIGQQTLFAMGITFYIHDTTMGAKLKSAFEKVGLRSSVQLNPDFVGGFLVIGPRN
jgi:hypothetical protein